VLHLLAVAGRLGVPLELADFDRLTADIPLLVDLAAVGKFLMEDLHYAGGLPAVMRELSAHFIPTPRHLGRFDRYGFRVRGMLQPRVIRTLAEPANPVSGIWVLKGNLCPNGAVMSRSAAAARCSAPRPRRGIRIHRRPACANRCT